MASNIKRDYDNSTADRLSHSVFLVGDFNLSEIVQSFSTIARPASLLWTAIFVWTLRRWAVRHLPFRSADSWKSRVALHCITACREVAEIFWIGFARV